MNNEERIAVGAVIGAFGVKGELRIKSFCAEPEAIASYSPLTDKNGMEKYNLRITGPVKGGFAARIKGIRFRDQAEALKGLTLYAARDQLPNLPDDEYYYSDLIGLAVIDTGGVRLGRVAAVYDHGAGDILEITTKSKPALLPFTKEAVPTVDLTAGKIVVDPPEGIFEDASNAG